MPKRVIDGEGMWGSVKLSNVPEDMIPEYAWLYPLADANGSFEVTNLRVVWAKVAGIRPHFTVERLREVFGHFWKVGLLFQWEEGGRKYAHWTGSERRGRLPSPSQRKKFGEPLAPAVPSREYRQYCAKHQVTDDPQLTFDNSRLNLDSLQTGVGVGVGEGEGVGDGGRTRPARKPTPPEALAFAGKYLRITQEEHRKLCAHFAAGFTEADVMACYRANDIWQDANPARRKRNSYAAMLNWLKIEQKGRDSPNGSHTAATGGTASPVQRAAERSAANAASLNSVFEAAEAMARSSGRALPASTDSTSGGRLHPGPGRSHTGGD